MANVAGITKTDAAATAKTDAAVTAKTAPVTLHDRMAARGIVKTDAASGMRYTNVTAAAGITYMYDDAGAVDAIAVTAGASVDGMTTDVATAKVTAMAVSEDVTMTVCKSSRTLKDENGKRAGRVCDVKSTEAVRVFYMQDAAIPDYRDGGPEWTADKASGGSVRATTAKGGTGDKSVFTFGSIDLIDSAGNIFRSSDIVAKAAAVAGMTIAATAGIFEQPLAVREYTGVAVTLKREVAAMTAVVESATAELAAALAAGDMTTAAAAMAKLQDAQAKLKTFSAL